MSKHYSDAFWLKAQKSCELCQLITKPHDEVKRGAGELKGVVDGFVKEDYIVIEYHDFVIVAFREHHDFSKGTQYGPFTEDRENCGRHIKQLEEKRGASKPVYFAGYGHAGVAAIYTAKNVFVSGVFTFGLPEKIAFESEPLPGFPRFAVYNFQLEDDPGVRDSLIERCSSRLQIPGKYIEEGDRKKEGPDRFTAPLSYAVNGRWRPEVPLDSLDVVLEELEQPLPSLAMPHHKQQALPADPLKSPIKIVVLWHGDDAKDTEPYICAFRSLFDQTTGSQGGYLTGATGLRSVPRIISQLPCDNEGEAIAQYFDDTLHTVLVVLADTHLESDVTWMKWLDTAASVCDEKCHRILPIALHDRVFTDIRDYPNFSRIQNVTTSAFGQTEVLAPYAALLALHTTYTLVGDALEEKKRLKVFVSHAKQDGLPLAEAILGQLSQIPGNLDRNAFYDAEFLEAGRRWDIQLRENAGNCVMLVLRTETYESRPWCRDEFLTAVKADVPIIVVDARFAKSETEEQGLDASEDLPFAQYPVTSVRDGNLIRVAGLVLGEGLRHLILQRDVEQLFTLGIAEREATRIFRLGSGMEGLMSLCEGLFEKDKTRRSCMIVHGERELNKLQHGAYEHIIRGYFRDGNLRTCTKRHDEILSYDESMETKLTHQKVGISIASVPGELEEPEANKLTTHTVERLFSHGGSVVFGHDWREGGIMEAVYKSLKQSQSTLAPDEDEKRIFNLVPWLNGKSTSEGKKLERELNLLQVDETGLPEFDQIPDFKSFVSKHAKELMKAFNAVALTKMREELTEACDARICIGGKMKGSTGTMAGILEEADLAIQRGQPLYLCGHWGGATGAICDILLKKSDPSPEEFLPAFEVEKQLDVLRNEPHSLKIDGPKDPIDRIKSLSMDALSAANGLDEKENRKLFELSDIRQIMSLVIKGLGQVKK